MSLVYKSSLVKQLKSELLSHGINPLNITFGFDGDDLKFSNSIIKKEIIKPTKVSVKKNKKQDRVSVTKLQDLIDEKGIIYEELAKALGKSTFKIGSILNRTTKTDKEDLRILINFCQKHKGNKKRVYKLDSSHLQKHLTERHGELVPDNELKNMKSLVEQSKLSQTELSNLSGVSYALINKWLNNKVRPRRNVFDKFMNIFNKSDLDNIVEFHG